MKIRIAEELAEVAENTGSVICVVERREIGCLSGGNNIERSIVLPIFQVDENIQTVMLLAVDGGVLFLARVKGHWHAVAIEK